MSGSILLGAWSNACNHPRHGSLPFSTFEFWQTHLLLAAIAVVQLQIAADVGARRSIGIHCCTFALTDEALDEPPT
jgi:hypothetical protein